MALRLHWPDERYVRVYVRDTIEWSALSWDAQALYVQLLRKADRRGRVDLGRVGRRGLAALLGKADLWPRLEPALAELEADGCVHVQGNVLVVAEFVEAQEAVSSSKRRSADWRERQRLEGGPRDETLRDGETGDRNGTSRPSDETSRSGDETSRRDETSRNATPGYSTDGTAQRSTDGTALASDGTGSVPSQSSPPGKPNGSPVASERAGALSASASQVLGYLQKHRAGRQLIDISEDLGISLPSAEGAARELRTRALVEWVQLGRPPIATLRLVP